MENVPWCLHIVSRAKMVQPQLVARLGERRSTCGQSRKITNVVYTKKVFTSELVYLIKFLCERSTISYSYNEARSSVLPPLHSSPLDIPHPSLPPPAYSRRCSISPSTGVTIVLSCPRLSSCRWCLRLYAMVFGGCGVLFSILWLVGHVYVLSQTQEKDLRIQR